MVRLIHTTHSQRKKTTDLHNVAMERVPHGMRLRLQVAAAATTPVSTNAAQSRARKPHPLQRRRVSLLCFFSVDSRRMKLISSAQSTKKQKRPTLDIAIYTHTRLCNVEETRRPGTRTRGRVTSQTVCVCAVL